MGNALKMLLVGILLAGLVGCATGQGPGFTRQRSSNWLALNRLQAPAGSFSVWAEGDQQVKIEESVRFRVVSSQTGRLWVLQVDPEDRFSLIYPNRWARNNQLVSHQPLVLPEKGSAWNLTAGRAAGRNMIAFIVTTDEMDLEDLADRSGNAVLLTQRLEGLSDWSLAKMVVEVE